MRPVTPAPARRRRRDLNESMAKTVADHPGRFGMFANLPLPDIDASLREMEYAMGPLKANGVHLVTSYQSTTFLGDPKFDPLFEELNRRKIVVKTHPAGNPCCQALPANTGFDGGLVELGTDTMRAIGRMVFSGAAEKFKDVPIICRCRSYCSAPITPSALRFKPSRGSRKAACSMRRSFAPLGAATGANCWGCMPERPAQCCSFNVREAPTSSEVAACPTGRGSTA